MVALQTQRPKVTTQEGLKLKLPTQKQFMAGSHVLGQYFSLKRSIFASTETVCCPFSLQ